MRHTGSLAPDELRSRPCKTALVDEFYSCIGYKGQVMLQNMELSY